MRTYDNDSTINWSMNRQTSKSSPTIVSKRAKRCGRPRSRDKTITHQDRPTRVLKHLDVRQTIVGPRIDQHNDLILPTNLRTLLLYQDSLFLQLNTNDESISDCVP